MTLYRDIVNEFVYLAILRRQVSYDIVHERTSHTCIAGPHRLHSQQQLHMAPTTGQTVQIGDSYLKDGHLPPERPAFVAEWLTHSAAMCSRA